MDPKVLNELLERRNTILNKNLEESETDNYTQSSVLLPPVNVYSVKDNETQTIHCYKNKNKAQTKYHKPLILLIIGIISILLIIILNDYLAIKYTNINLN